MSGTLKGKFQSIFTKKAKNTDNSGQSKAKKVLGKISGAFMLPIAIMAISGLWLGIGAAINSNTSNESLKMFGSFIRQLGNPVFAALPLLFAVAMVIAFTDEAGVAVFATIIGFLVFLAIQDALIKEVRFVASATINENGKDVTLSLSKASQIDLVSKTITFDGGVTKSFNDLANATWTESSTGSTVDLTKLLKDNKTFVELGGNQFSINKLGDNLGYNILFVEGGRAPWTVKAVVSNQLGYVKSLSTSVFGGILIGILVQWIYNRFHTISFPAVFSFFAGKRFVAIVTVPFTAALSVAFLLFWPWVGTGLSLFGNALGKVPYGFESLIFGFIERSLIPFGLHHAFYSPLWYSQAGGDLAYSLAVWQTNSTWLTEQALQSDTYKNLSLLIQHMQTEGEQYVGDSAMALKLVQLPFNDITFQKDGQNITLPLFDFISKEVGIKVGRFADGKFSFMMFGLPAAAAAMVVAAPKENRKVALSAILPSAITSFVTGVTEPIEFTFLFLSPTLFWGFHAVLAGFSFMFANLLGVHVPMAFSGGALDTLIYGIIPFQKGTNFYWTLVVGLAYAPIYFFLFWWWIKFRDLATPGRGGNTRLFTKKDMISKKGSNNIDPQALAVVAAYGGTGNIVAYTNCASRLRYDVHDASKVDADALKAAGAINVIKQGNHVQAIFGPIAEQLNVKIRNSRESIAKLEVEGMANVQANLETKQESNLQTKLQEPVVLGSVANGRLITLEEVNDGVFSTKALGDGYAVEFETTKTGKVYAPVDSEVKVVFGESKHAYGLSTKEGIELLIHIGIDTVNLNGEGFTSFVKVGDKVKRGDLIAEVDLEVLKKHNLKSCPILIVLNESQHKDITFRSEAKEVSPSYDVLKVQ